MYQPPTSAEAPYPTIPNQTNGAAQERANWGLSQVVVTSLLVVLAFGSGWFGNGYVNRANTIPADDVNQRVLNQVWTEISNNYVFTNNIDKQKMAYAAIDAMIQTLNDPGHTRFETPDQFKNESSQLQNDKVIGIGVYLSGGGTSPLTITGIMPNSPASKADMRAGDQIVAVDGKSIKGFTLDQARPLIKGDGKAGSSVTLTLVRPIVSPTDTHDVTLTRAEITPPTAVSFILSDVNIADIQLLDFSANADSEIQKAIKDAQSHNVGGIILDLRGNGGGLLEQAVKVTSEFVPAGANKNVMILHTRQSTQKLPVTTGGLATTTPLVVLVDGNSASAAEITAGAIGINRADALTLGQTTFGTGTVLQARTLADGSTLVLGTEEWRLPNDQSVYHVGYTPKQVVSLPTNVVPFTPLAAQNVTVTTSDIQKANDTQLTAAIAHLKGLAG